MDQLINGFESHVMTAILVSGVLALLIVAAVAFVWWRGRDWVNRSRATLGRATVASGWHASLFSQMDDPPPARPGGSAGPTEPAPGGEEQFGSRLVREAAVRAAALRDAWDRSYREARGSSPASATPTPGADLPGVMDELLREQRETNALLRQLVDRLGQRES